MFATSVVTSSTYQSKVSKLKLASLHHDYVANNMVSLRTYKITELDLCHIF